MSKVLLDTTVILHIYRKRKEATQIINEHKNKMLCISIITYTEIVANTKIENKISAKKNIEYFHYFAN